MAQLDRPHSLDDRVSECPDARTARVAREAPGHACASHACDAQPALSACSTRAWARHALSACSAICGSANSTTLVRASALTQSGARTVTPPVPTYGAWL